MAETDTGTFETSGNTTGSTESHSKAHDVMAGGKEKASELSDVARRKMMEKADAKKSDLSSSLDRLAQSLEDLGGSDGGSERQIGEFAAKYVRRAKDLIDGRSSDELMNMAVSELKERPAAIVAGLFAVGFFGARLLRS